jgi:hypothetical protein
MVESLVTLRHSSCTLPSGTLMDMAMQPGRTSEALASRSGLRCPFCAAPGAELLSLFGSQLLLSQYRCANCRGYFEGLRPDRWEEVATTDPGGFADDR